MSTPDPSEPPRPRSPSPFPLTTDSVWQQVHDAGTGDVEAVGRLCVLYREAIFAYVRRWRWDVHEAEDLTQAFLVKILEKNPFLGFQRRETKFRSFLLRCLGNFLRDQIRVRPPETVSLEDDDFSPSGEPGADALDTDLALEIHHRVARRLEERFVNKGMAQRFFALRTFILGADDRYASAAESLGITSGALRKAMFDLREEYHDGFREAVAHLVTREEIVGEMKYLLGLLARLPSEALWPDEQASDLKEKK